MYPFLLTNRAGHVVVAAAGRQAWAAAAAAAAATTRRATNPRNRRGIYCGEQGTGAASGAMISSGPAVLRPPP